jgi:hypothetical protein
MSNNLRRIAPSPFTAITVALSPIESWDKSFIFASNCSLFNFLTVVKFYRKIKTVAPFIPMHYITILCLSQEKINHS